MVMGTLDPRWRVRRISVEVTDGLGFAQEDCVGVPVLDAVHPMDAPTLLSHMTSLAPNATAGALHLRATETQGMATLAGRRLFPDGIEAHAVRICAVASRGGAAARARSGPFAPACPASFSKAQLEGEVEVEVEAGSGMDPRRCQ